MAVRNLMAMLVALALCAAAGPASADAFGPGALVLSDPDFLKGADTAPPAERRSAPARGNPDFLNATEARVVATRFVRIGPDGNDRGGFVTYDFTPVDYDHLPADAPARGPEAAASNAAGARLLFLRQCRGDCIPEWEDEGPSAAGGYVAVLATVLAGKPGCLMIEADSRELVRFGRDRVRAAATAEYEAGAKAMREERRRQSDAVWAMVRQQGRRAEANRSKASAADSGDGAMSGLANGVALLLVMVGGFIWWALGVGRDAKSEQSGDTSSPDCSDRPATGG